AATERRELERDVEEIDVALSAKSGEAAEQERAHARLEGTWKAAIAPLGVQGDLGAEAVTITIDLLGEMFHKLDQAAATRRRAVGIERDGRAFATDVAALAERHAPDLLGRAPEQIAASLIERYNRGREDLVLRRALDRQIADTEELLRRQRERARAAEAHIADLIAAAGVASVRDLEDAEQRSLDARDLDRQIASSDA